MKPDRTSLLLCLAPRHPSPFCSLNHTPKNLRPPRKKLIVHSEKKGYNSIYNPDFPKSIWHHSKMEIVETEPGELKCKNHF